MLMNEKDNINNCATKNKEIYFFFGELKYRSVYSDSCNQVTIVKVSSGA